MPTTQEICARLDIHRATLLRWVTAGFVDKPSSTSGPNGMGRTNFYPERAFQQAKAVSFLLRNGFAMASLSDALAAGQSLEELVTEAQGDGG